MRPSATMINCQERGSCQLASDLCALYPNHLLRGKRSCLSDYNGLYTHLCHGKGELPWCGLLLSVARHRSCLAPICHLCVPCRYCLIRENSDYIVLVLPQCSRPLQSECSFNNMSRQGKGSCKRGHSFFFFFWK